MRCVGMRVRAHEVHARARARAVRACAVRACACAVRARARAVRARAHAHAVCACEHVCARACAGVHVCVMSVFKSVCGGEGVCEFLPLEDKKVLHYTISDVLNF